MLAAGSLRHRITVQSKVETIDPDTGYRTWVWMDRLIDEPASWLSGPGREYLASEATRQLVEGRMVIRWSPKAAGILGSDRVIWDGRVLELKAPPICDDSARRLLTLLVGEAGTDGS